MGALLGKLGLFRARQAPPAGDALPASVERALAGLTASPRPEHEGRARVLLHWAGGGAWHHTPAETRERLATAWPELSEGQLDRACRAVAGTVAQAQRGQLAAPGRKWSASHWAPRTFENTPI